MSNSVENIFSADAGRLDTTKMKAGPQITAKTPLNGSFFIF